MSDSHLLAKNGLIQLGGRTIGMAVGLITVMLITRALGDTAYGQFTNAFTFLAVVGSLADMGFTLTTVQLLAEKGANEARILSTAFTTRCISGVFLFLLAIPVAKWMGYDTITQTTIQIGTLSFFCMVAAQMLLGVFQKHLAMWKPSVAEAGSRLLVLLGVWLATQNIATPATIMIAFLAGNIALFFANLHGARQLIPFSFTIHPPTLRLFFSRSWPMALSICFNLIYLKGDIIFLHLFGRPLAEIGHYGAAYKVLDVIAVLPSIVMGLLLPPLTLAWSEKNQEKFQEHLQQAVDAFALLSLPILIGGALLATPVMTLVSGNEFAPAGPYLAILLLANMAVFFGILFGHAVVAIGKQKAILPAYALTALLTVGLYYWSVPRWGATGAAWSTVFSEAFILLCTFAMIRWHTKCHLAWTRFRDAGIASLYMGLGIVFASIFLAEHNSLAPHWQTILVIFLGIVLYTLFLFLFGAINRQTVKNLLNTR